MIASLLDDHASELWSAVSDMDDPVASARIILVANALENMAAVLRGDGYRLVKHDSPAAPQEDRPA